MIDMEKLRGTYILLRLMLWVQCTRFVIIRSDYCLNYQNIPPQQGFGCTLYIAAGLNATLPFLISGLMASKMVVLTSQRGLSTGHERFYPQSGEENTPFLS